MNHTKHHSLSHNLLVSITPLFSTETPPYPFIVHIITIQLFLLEHHHHLLTLLAIFYLVKTGSLETCVIVTCLHPAFLIMMKSSSLKPYISAFSSLNLREMEKLTLVNFFFSFYAYYINECSSICTYTYVLELSTILKDGWGGRLKIYLLENCSGQIFNN